MIQGECSHLQKSNVGLVAEPSVGSKPGLRKGQEPGYSGAGSSCSSHGPKEFVYSASLSAHLQVEVKHQNPIFCHLAKL